MVPDFMIRVKLPNPNAFASCPSGDTEYQTAYDDALAEARPPSFEYIYPRTGESWPKDTEGWTWARLRCTDESEAISSAYLARVSQLERRLKTIVEQLRPLLSTIH